jgi:rhamnogalacturonan II specific xylosyltransferase
VAASANEAAKDKSWTVVLMTISDGYYDFFLNWLAFFERLKLTSLPVIVVAEDDVVLEKLQNQRLPGQFKIEWSQLKFERNEIRAFNYESKPYRKMVSTRATVLLEKLQQGMNILYSDIDTVWLSNPIPHMDRYNVDIVAQMDDNTPWKKKPYYYLCTGFMGIRSNKRTIEFMKEWQDDLSTAKLNQPSFNKILEQRLRKGLNTYRPLPFDQFPHGQEYFTGKTLTQKKAVVVHNNYIVGHDQKKKRFQRHHLWIVPERSCSTWRKFFGC